MTTKAPAWCVDGTGQRTVTGLDPQNQLVMVLLVERFDMTGEEQKVLYGSFLKAAISHSRAVRASVATGWAELSAPVCSVAAVRQ